MEKVNFYHQNKFKNDVARTYCSQKERILHLIPDADIQHVGSTSIPNSLTKGDIDIQVRVDQKQFTQAVEALSAVYESKRRECKNK